MQTITFFSYKGGTGRSLAVANAACYLTQLGFKVVVLDFDLEAPGQTYKLSKAEDGAPLDVKRGLVDYLFSFVVDAATPSSLSDYTLPIAITDSDGSLTLIPAGQAPSEQYWDKLCRLNWHELFYAPDATGVQLFLDLKAKIEEELHPDFLLIDSRTGVTEMGGVATTILADTVVCILLNNRENMEGARTVLRSLKRSWQNRRGEVSLVVALSQLPELEDLEEHSITSKIRAFFCEDAEKLDDSLSINEVFVLHSEPALQLRESLRVGRGMSLDESVLLRDYLKLFSHVVPAELIEPRISKLFDSAKRKIWDDPDAATSEMEQLASFYGRHEGLREVLRIYLIRNIGGSRALKVAQSHWELTNHVVDPIVARVASRCFKDLVRSQREAKGWRPRLDFIDSVWLGSGMQDAELGQLLADAYVDAKMIARAAEIYLRLVDGSESGRRYLGRCLQLLVSCENVKEARRLIGKFGPEVADDRFVSAWAELALSVHDADYLIALSADPILPRLVEADPRAAIRVLEAAGREKDIDKYLGRLLNSALERGSTSFALEIGRIYARQGRSKEFDERVRDILPGDEAESFLQGARRRYPIFK